MNHLDHFRSALEALVQDVLNGLLQSNPEAAQALAAQLEHNAADIRVTTHMASLHIAVDLIPRDGSVAVSLAELSFAENHGPVN